LAKKEFIRKSLTENHHLFLVIKNTLLVKTHYQFKTAVNYTQIVANVKIDKKNFSQTNHNMFNFGLRTITEKSFDFRVEICCF